MAKYNWTFATIGGTTRVKIQSGEDIRHLHELDEKLWTVLSCPVAGLEIPEESLRLIDTTGDGVIHIREVVETADWLCSVLHDPKVLLQGVSQLRIADIADDSIRTTATKIAKNDHISLEMLTDAMANITVDTQALPEAPYPADIMAAYKACQPAYDAYFTTKHLQDAGLATLPADSAVPGMEEEAFHEMGTKIAAYEAAVADIQAGNAAATTAAQAEYMPLRKLLLLNRDFYTLLRNFVSFQDFYAKRTFSPIGKEDKSNKQAIFQAGTLVIDQRACHLCLRVNDMAKHDAQAAASGMFLVYCNCTYQGTGEKMQIVAAITVGDIRNLKVGKRALFYDRQGRDWDAEVVKIIDNPISIAQAFWSPYRKFGDWLTNLINKSAADKENKAFADITTKVQEDAKKPIEDKSADKVQAFDIAKFAGIFAAIGMALGSIGTFLLGIANGFMVMPWWKDLLAIVAILLVISGPAMIMAWFKLRKRNLSPLLNANGWAVNADAIVSVMFGGTLTEQAQFPLIKTPKPKLSKGAKWAIAIAAVVLALAIAAAVLYGLGIIAL